MEVRTKFEINQKVFILREGKVVQSPILSIHMVIGSNFHKPEEIDVTERYHLASSGELVESKKIFLTREDLLASL